MSLSSLLSHWRADPEVGGNVIEWRTIPAHSARLQPFPVDLHPLLVDALHIRKIHRLYTHQIQAWLHANNGSNFVIVTGTASGKTLCYNLPVLDCLLRNESATALYLFPTKALAQDQLSGLIEYLDTQANDSIEKNPSQPSSLKTLSSICPGTYDGDTPAHIRSTIRSKVRLLLSNPDMLHTGILPHHTGWAAFFKNLRFVVIDELHTYRGVFGSHVSNVIRRLKRVAAHYGAKPQFILTSATIANPVELAQWLVEEPVILLDEDGSGCGPRHIMLFNPPIINEELGIRRGTLSECIRLAQDLLAYNIQTIVFAQTRRGVEILLRNLRDRESEDESADEDLTPSLSSDKDIPIRGYRSGYLSTQRREIELGLREGNIRAVAATNALELGIDIGGMGAAILAGYPGTIASTRQQMGRAGRGSDPSLAILVASPNPLDQYLIRHPEFIFEHSPERALVNPNHLLILLEHLRCAAFELPFEDGQSFGTLESHQLSGFLEFLRQEGVLHHSKGCYYWMAEQYPARAVSLRNTSLNTVVLQKEEKVIGIVDAPSAVWMVHPGAVYLHEGQMFMVDALDLDENRASLRLTDPGYYTDPRRETTVALIEKLGESSITGGIKTHGEITVTTLVTGYRKLRWGTSENLGFEPLDLPPSTLQTTGYWLALADETVEMLKEEGFWSNAPNNYGPGWLALTKLVRARDGFRCQMCGANEKDRAHDIHHKIPFRAFPSAEQANRLENLITLCPACHKKAETSVRIRSGLAGLSFLLVNLAPLFLMCDPRDLGVYADPQSPLAEGKSTVALYDQVPAGIGFSAQLYEANNELLTRAYEVVSTCPCTDGCPSCVGPGGEGGSGGKQEAIAILHKLTQHPSP
jgi:DEAD/DEAH box helicase domain-containing protein